MEKQINQLDNCLQEMIITVSRAEAQPYFDKAYMELLPQISLKGFRKGKAPMQLIKQAYGKAIEQDRSSDMFNELFMNIIKQEKIHVVGEPHITSISFNGDKIIGTFRYEYIPPFELSEYKGLTIDEPVYTVGDEDVEERINQILKHSGTFVDADIVDNEEFVVGIKLKEIDAETLVPIIGGKEEETHVYLADEVVLPGLRENIIGLSIGDSFKFNPKDDEKINKSRCYLITVTEIQRLVPADLTDEFVSNYTEMKFNNIEDFRTDIKYKLQKQWDEKSRNYMIRQIEKKLVDANPIQLPESSVYSLMNSMVEDLKEKYKDIESSRYLTVDSMSDDLRPAAERMLRWYIIKRKIIELENLKVEEQDIAEIAEVESNRLHSDLDSVKRNLMNNTRLTSIILERKAIDLILGFAITNQIDFDDIDQQYSKGESDADYIDAIDEGLENKYIDYDKQDGGYQDEHYDHKHHHHDVDDDYHHDVDDDYHHHHH